MTSISTNNGTIRTPIFGNASGLRAVVAVGRDSAVMRQRSGKRHFPAHRHVACYGKPASSEPRLPRMPHTMWQPATAAQVAELPAPAWASLVLARALSA